MATTLTLSEAVTALQQGGVIAYPTEAVWGLGCDPRQETAVHTLLNIKQRASGKGLILVTAELNTLQDWLDLDTLSPERLHEVKPVGLVHIPGSCQQAHVPPLDHRTP